MTLYFNGEKLIKNELKTTGTEPKATELIGSV